MPMAQDDLRGSVWPAPIVPSPSSNIMSDLDKLMDWRSKGLLSDSEFVAAKRRLGF